MEKRRELYKIEIRDLELDVRVGLLHQEKRIDQKIRFDIDIFYNDKKDFIDYAKIINIVTKVSKNRDYKLVEDLIDIVIESIYDKNITKGSIKVSKNEIFGNAIVSIKKEF